MTIMFIRVFAGFLAGLAAGILLARIAYKKAGTVKSVNPDTREAVTSTKTS